MTNASIIDEIFALIRTHGEARYGEDITQIEHFLQCGHLARADGAQDALIAAALLHDIGQFIDDAGNAAQQRGVDARHEVIGAQYLAPYFPAAVTDPVRLHVEAKRYLCAAEPGYEQGLSAASILSLGLQGGAYDAVQMAAFRALPGASDALRLRRYDDAGKLDGCVVPDLESYRPLLAALLVEPSPA